MFSIVQNISSAFKPYEAEAADARLQDRKQGSQGSANQHAKDEGAQDMIEEEQAADFSTLSIKSLILFLEDYVETKLASSLFYEGNPQKAPDSPWVNKQHGNDNPLAEPPAKAVKAYAHAAKTRTYTRQKVQAQAEEQQETLKNVYALITDLREIQNNGVQYLRVDSRKTFINGIFEAVRAVKSSHYV